MGTRSLTRFQEADGDEICVMYRQMDGYPSGHGKDLADFLSGFKIVNGIGSEKGKIANGMGCLTAQTIAHFKTGVGSFYIHKADTKDCGEEYTYTIKPIEKILTIKCEHFDDTIFAGSVKEFKQWTSKGGNDE